MLGEELARAPTESPNGYTSKIFFFAIFKSRSFSRKT